MGAILWGLLLCPKRGEYKCRRNRNDRVLIPDAPSWQTEDFAKNTKQKKTNATKNISVTPKVRKGTAERGNESETDILRSFRFVRCVRNTADWPRLRRFTTYFRCHEAERMRRAILWACASLATRKLQLKMVKDGTHTSIRRGGLNLCEPIAEERAPPFTHKKSEIKRVIKLTRILNTKGGV